MKQIWLIIGIVLCSILLSGCSEEVPEDTEEFAEFSGETDKAPSEENLSSPSSSSNNDSDSDNSNKKKPKSSGVKPLDALAKKYAKLLDPWQPVGTLTELNTDIDSIAGVTRVGADFYFQSLLNSYIYRAEAVSDTDISIDPTSIPIEGFSGTTYGGALTSDDKGCIYGFIGPGSSSYVYRYNTNTGMTSKVLSASFIYKAGITFIDETLYIATRDSIRKLDNVSCEIEDIDKDGDITIEGSGDLIVTSANAPALDNIFGEGTSTGTGDSVYFNRIRSISAVDLFGIPILLVTARDDGTSGATFFIIPGEDETSTYIAKVFGGGETFPDKDTNTRVPLKDLKLAAPNYTLMDGLNIYVLTTQGLIHIPLRQKLELSLDLKESPEAGEIKSSLLTAIGESLEAAELLDTDEIGGYLYQMVRNGDSLILTSIHADTIYKLE